MPGPFPLLSTWLFPIHKGQPPQLSPPSPPGPLGCLCQLQGTLSQWATLAASILTSPRWAWWAPGCRHGSHDAPRRVDRGQALAPAGTRRTHHPHSGPRPGAGDRWHYSGTNHSPDLPGSPGRRNRRRRPRSGRAPGRRRRSPGKVTWRSGVKLQGKGQNLDRTTGIKGLENRKSG